MPYACRDSHPHTAAAGNEYLRLNSDTEEDRRAWLVKIKLGIQENCKGGENGPWERG